MALALVADPKLVVLDEMATGLDPGARRVAWGLVGGTLVAAGTAADLIEAHRPGIVVRFTRPDGPEVGFLREVPRVRSVDA